MEQLFYLGIFLACLGVFLAGLGFLWWVSVYDKVKSPKAQKQA
jgi:hypothetical protein